MIRESDMRVVFMGYQTWGHRVLEALIGSDHEVPLVITHPASEHPYEAIWNDSVAGLAAARGIPVIERRYANDTEVLSLVAGLAPDILVSSDWRTWVSPDLYKLATHGAINVHEMPCCRGTAASRRSTGPSSTASRRSASPPTS
jgi:methionyl-tRNA formyltransferase